jgi:hypothetical protein
MGFGDVIWVASTAASVVAAAGAVGVFAENWPGVPTSRRVCMLPAALATPAVCGATLGHAPPWMGVVCWMSFLFSLQSASLALVVPKPPRTPLTEAREWDAEGDPWWWTDFERAFRRYAAEQQ